MNDQEAIAHDTPCRRCGYSLRGLVRDGLCPGSTAPIGVSVQENLLCYAEPQYFQRLARGNRWVFRGMALTLLTFLAFLLTALVVTRLAAADPNASAFVDRVCQGLAMVGVYGGLLIGLVGVWLLTGAERTAHEARHRERARRLVRLYLLLGFLGALLMFIFARLAPPSLARTAFQVLMLGPSVFGVVGIAAYFRYLRGIAERIPDQAVAKEVSEIGRFLVVATAVLVVLATIDALAQWVSALRPMASTTAPATAPTAKPFSSGCCLEWNPNRDRFAGAAPWHGHGPSRGRQADPKGAVERKRCRSANSE